ncbi:MAG: hypothetical protein JW913_06625 [Chitinispirillaceae bacterium]|nr:hypothetical protein [Chitinispirillaceae bacterium]
MLAIILITWYGKQTSNNPFHTVSRIVISGNSDNLSMYHYTKDNALVILPFDSGSPPPPTFPLPKLWELVSRSESVAADQFPHPPEAWQVLDTIIHSIKQPVNWPPPRSFQKNGFKNCLIKLLHPFNDQRNALLVTLAGIGIILIDASEFRCTLSDTTRLREKSELVIIIHADNQSAIRCRSVFRPRFTIAFGTFGENIHSYPNLLMCPVPASEQIIFKTSGKQRIVFQGRRSSAPRSP